MQPIFTIRTPWRRELLTAYYAKLVALDIIQERRILEEGDYVTRAINIE